MDATITGCKWILSSLTEVHTSCMNRRIVREKKDSCPREKGFKKEKRRFLCNFLLLLIWYACRPWQKKWPFLHFLFIQIFSVFFRTLSAHSHDYTCVQAYTLNWFLSSFFPLLPSLTNQEKQRERKIQCAGMFPFALMHVSLMLKPLKSRECYLPVLLFYWLSLCCDIRGSIHRAHSTLLQCLDWPDSCVCTTTTRTVSEPWLAVDVDMGRIISYYRVICVYLHVMTV